MRISRTVCDRCQKDVPCQSFFVETDRRLDPAGSMESVGENVDVCPRCLMAAVTRSLMVNAHAADHAKGTEFLAWLRDGFV